MEKIGLEAVLKIDAFRQAMNEYVQRIGQMVSGTTRASADVTEGFKGVSRVVALPAEAMQKLQTAIARTENQIGSLAPAIDLQKRSLSLLEGELFKTAKQYGFASVQAQKKELALDRLRQAMASNESRLAGYQNALSRMQGELADSADATEDLQTETEDLQKTLPKASQGADKASSAVDRLGDVAGRAKAQISTLQVAVLGAAAGFGTLAAEAVKAAGSAIVGAISGSIEASKNLEAQLSDIRAVLGGTSDDMAQLKRLTSDLGMDPNLKVSAFQAADAIGELARNGLGLQDILGGAARSTVLLANATGGDFGLAANIATDAMAIFNIKASDMAEAVNGIVSVTDASKFGIQDYAYALAQGGGVAGAVGVEFADFNATIAAISPLFAAGSDAGTSFKTFLQRLAPDTTPAKDALRSLGIITEDGTNRFFTATGQLKSMAEIAGILNTATRGLSEEQKNLAFQTAFGTDAMRAAFGLSKFTEQAYRELQATMGQTDALEAAGIRMDNLAGSLEIFGGVIETLKIRIGDVLNPILRDLVNWGTEIAATFGGGIVGAFERLQQVSQAAGGGLLGFLAGAGFDPQLAASILYLRDRVIELVGEFRENFAPVIESVQRTLAGTLDAFKNFGAGGLTEILTFVRGGETEFNNLKALLTGVGDNVNRLLGDLGRFVADNLPVWQNNLAVFGREAWQWLERALPLVQAQLGLWAQGLGEWLAENFPTWTRDLAKWGTAAADWLRDAVPETIAAASEWLGELVRWATSPEAQGDLSEIWKQFKETAVPALLELDRTIKLLLIDMSFAVLKGGISIGGALIDGILQALTGKDAWLGESIANVINTLIDEGREAAEARSPSRKSARLIGLPIGQGVAVGVLDALPMIQAAASQAVSAAMPTIQQPVFHSPVASSPMIVGGGGANFTNSFGDIVLQGGVGGPQDARNLARQGGLQVEGMLAGALMDAARRQKGNYRSDFGVRT